MSLPPPALVLRRVEAELDRFEQVPDVLLLAAADRAVRHLRYPDDRVSLSEVAWHLGFQSGAWTTRRLRPHLVTLAAAGALEEARRRGIPAWRVTSRGRAQLRRAYQGGKVPALPEAPQHRIWRQTRAVAGEQIDGARERVRALLADAGKLLDSPGAAEDWDRTGAALREAWRALAIMDSCLREWPEPDDEHADAHARRLA